MKKVIVLILMLALICGVGVCEEAELSNYQGTWESYEVFINGERAELAPENTGYTITLVIDGTSVHTTNTKNYPEYMSAVFTFEDGMLKYADESGGMAIKYISEGEIELKNTNGNSISAIVRFKQKTSDIGNVPKSTSFMGIPWGSSAKEIEGLIGGGYSVEWVAPYEAWFDEPLYDRLIIYNNKSVSKELIGWQTNHYCSDLQVAGYDVWEVIGYSICGFEGGRTKTDIDDSRLYAGEYVFNVRDKYTAYLSLQAKLKEKYGEYKEDTYNGGFYSINSEGMTNYKTKQYLSKWRTWDGITIILDVKTNKSDTGETKETDESLTLSYVKSMDEEIAVIDQARKRELDAIEHDNDMTDFDGL